MQVNYVSDLHIEINGRGRLDQKWAPADVLVLAGDTLSVPYLHPQRNDSEARSVKKTWEYLKKNIFPQYKKIFLIMGNHDHYQHVFKNTADIWREHIKDVPNLVFLENQDYFFEDTLFVGCTLWTNFLNGNPSAMMIAQGYMNDYYLILEKKYEELSYQDRMNWNHKKPVITPEFIYDVHQKSMIYLKEIVELNNDLKVVVITHHAPSFQSIHGRHVGDNASPAYASNLEEFILDNPNIKVWLHGHTHHSCKYQIGETKILSNQCGYKGETSYYHFNPDQTFEV